MTPETRVGICHRNRLFGECLASSLSSQLNVVCSVIPSIAFTAEARQNVDTEQVFELLVLDVSLPEDLSSRIAATVRQFQPACKLLLLIAEPAVSRIVELARWESDGCLFEEVTLAEINDAIKCVISGKSFYSPEIVNAMFAQVSKAERDSHWNLKIADCELTSREREILELIAYEKYSNKQIARQLNLSLYTVKNHVHNIIETLGVADRHEAVELAQQKKIVSMNRTPSAYSRAKPIPR